MKSVRIRSYSGLYFLTFGLNTDTDTFLHSAAQRGIRLEDSKNLSNFLALSGH